MRTAALLIHGIAAAQAFRDGNRRTALLIAVEFLDAHGLGELIYKRDDMVARFLNRLVNDQGSGAPVRVTADTFFELFRRRFQRQDM